MSVEEKEVEDFYEYLTTALLETKYQMTCLMGDFNAQVQTQLADSEMAIVLDRVRKGEMTKDTTTFFHNQVYSMNITHRRWPWVSPNGNI